MWLQGENWRDSRYYLCVESTSCEALGMWQPFCVDPAPTQPNLNLHWPGEPHLLHLGDSQDPMLHSTNAPPEKL